MKLIDKAAVVAEIENLLDKGRHHDAYQCAYRDGNNGALYALKGKLDTLEVKEDFKDVKSVFEGQYLTKDKVVTTIERLQDECEEQGDNNGVELLEKLFNKLDTLEVEEVDIDKMLYFRRDIGFAYPEGASEYQKHLACYRQGIEDVLKAQKGE